MSIIRVYHVDTPMNEYRNSLVQMLTYPESLIFIVLSMDGKEKHYFPAETVIRIDETSEVVA